MVLHNQPRGFISVPAPGDLPPQPVEQLTKLFRRKRFEDIFVDLQPQGLLSILKIVIAAEDDHHGIRQMFPNVRGQYQAVGYWHADVGNHQIWPQTGFECVDGFLAIAAGIGGIEAEFLPRCGLKHGIEHILFVFGK